MRRVLALLALGLASGAFGFALAGTGTPMAAADLVDVPLVRVLDAADCPLEDDAT